MEFTDYLRILRRRWRVVVAVLLSGIAVSAFITWQTTPQYASSARLFVSTSEADTSDALQGNMFAAQRVQSYADIVPKSRRLAEQVVEDLGGGLTPGQVQSHISAEVVAKTVILEITSTDPDPVQARDIAQAYAEALSDLVQGLETPEGETNALIRADIIDNAQVSIRPVAPKPSRNLLIGFAAGLVFGLGLALLRDLMDNTVRTPADVNALTPAPVIGHLPNDTAAVRQAPTVALTGQSAWAESFRVLRTNMQYIEVDNDRKVFVVTSSLPGEGKSTTAVNLAVTLALTNQRVALVECDLRRPLIAKRIGLDGAIGTTSVLIGKITAREAMQSFGDSGLQVLTCGPIPPNPSELLQSRAMENLLSQLRADYDIVLLDAPPLLPVTDAALLTAQADGALIVARHGKTTRDQLSHAFERLDAVDAKTLGVVLNQVPSRGLGSTYSYSYSYNYASTPLDVAPTATVDQTLGETEKKRSERRRARSSSSQG